MTKAEQRKYVTIAAVIVAGYVVYRSQKTVQAVKQVVQTDLNPAHQENVVNRGFDSVYQSIFGPDRTLGSDIARWLHE